MPQTAGVDAMRDAEREVPLHRDLGMAEVVRRGEEGVDGQNVVLVAMHQQDRRRAARGRAGRGFAEVLRADQHAGIAQDRGRRPLAAKSDMQRHHGALAEADERQLALVEAGAGELAVEERIERRASLGDTAPAFAGVAHRQRKPLSARGGLAAAFGGVGCHEFGVRQPGLPLPSDLDQVVAVGAIAVEEYNDLARVARAGRNARAVDGGQGRILRLSKSSRNRGSRGCGQGCPTSSASAASMNWCFGSASTPRSRSRGPRPACRAKRYSINDDDVRDYPGDASMRFGGDYDVRHRVPLVKGSWGPLVW